MGTDLAFRPDGVPAQRLAAYAYQKEFGAAPLGVWYVPGTVTLLADRERHLVVTTQWGSVVAASPRPDDVVEAMLSNRPGERVKLTVSEAVQGDGPSWAGNAMRSARAGATLLASSDLPQGSGLGSAAATQAAIRLALRDLGALTEARAGSQADCQDDSGDAERGPGAGGQAATATLDGRRVPFDLAGAALRLVLVDTRVRGEAQQAVAEHAPMDAVASAVTAGEFGRLGPMLTAVHADLAPDEAQQVAVSAVLSAGALGARMMIDGPGRPVCALVPVPALPEVRSALSAAFAARGMRAPRVLTLFPSADRPHRVV